MNSKNYLIYALLLSAIAFAVIPAYPQAPNTMALNDFYSVRQLALAAPQISPDGSRVPYSLRVPDLAKNVAHTEMWIATTDGAGSPKMIRDLAKDGGNHFTWSVDSRSIYCVTTKGDEIRRIELAELSEQTVTAKSEWKLDEDNDLSTGPNGE